MDDLQELTNALSNATIYTASPSPRLGVRNPHSKLQSGFQTKLLGIAHSYASTVGSKKCSAEK